MGAGVAKHLISLHQRHRVGGYSQCMFTLHFTLSKSKQTAALQAAVPSLSRAMNPSIYFSVLFAEEIIHLKDIERR